MRFIKHGNALLEIWGNPALAAKLWAVVDRM
jgi:hypothetical protein